MKCKKIEELIPLHLSGDVKDRHAIRIAAHLASCTACARLAEEYRAVSEAMRAFEPPQFSEDFYAGIRGNVLRNIKEQPERSGWFQSLKLGLPAPNWAVAASMVLLISAAAFYQIRLRATSENVGFSHHSIEVAIAGSSDPLSISEHKELTGVSEISNPDNSPNWPRSTASKPHRSPRHRQSLSFASVALLSAKQNKSLFNGVISPQQTVKVELQTNDPNVRIIWFYNQPAEAGSPQEISKGM